jgi:hypothetical protein
MMLAQRGTLPRQDAGKDLVLLAAHVQSGVVGEPTGERVHGPGGRVLAERRALREVLQQAQVLPQWNVEGVVHVRDELRERGR